MVQTVERSTISNRPVQRSGALPPGPRGVPVLGMMPALRRDPLAVFTDAARQYGDVAHFAIGPRRGFLATNPDDIRHVLQDNARNYHKSPLYSRLKTTLGNGLLTSEDDFWLRQRRMAQPAFHRQRLAGLAAVMSGAAREVADRWTTRAGRGDVVDIADEMMVITRTIVLRTLLGASLGPFAAQVDNAWAVANQHIGESFWSLGIAEQWPMPKYWRFRRARAVLDGAVRHIISERRRAAHESPDLLSLLLEARDEDTGQGMTDEQVRDEVMTMLLAGQETTALALSWTWYLLSEHPEAQTRVEHEVDTVLEGRPPEYADLTRLPYTRMVIDEALRLYPPAWGFSRQALAPDQIGGYRLPKGWLVFLVPYVMHRHPAFWERPDRFEPERFAPGPVAARPKFVYFPFGAGPRQCIGNHFALMEAHLIVASLAQRYRLRLAAERAVEPWPLITLRPRHGMPMTIEARQRWGVMSRAASAAN